MRHTSCPVSPIPAHAFFEQAVLQGEVGHDLLQGAGFATRLLHLVRGRLAGGVAGQPPLAGVEEVLRPAIADRGGDALAPTQLGDAVLAAQALQHDADLLLGRELAARGPPDILEGGFRRRLGRPGCRLHLRSVRLRWTKHPPFVNGPDLSHEC
jgi:hypothetical protein